jgi:hypothetical protein
MGREIKHFTTAFVFARFVGGFISNKAAALKCIDSRL